jgi:hypothetical protein
MRAVWPSPTPPETSKLKKTALRAVFARQISFTLSVEKWIRVFSLSLGNQTLFTPTLAPTEPTFAGINSPT